MKTRPTSFVPFFPLVTLVLATSQLPRETHAGEAAPEPMESSAPEEPAVESDKVSELPLARKGVFRSRSSSRIKGASFDGATIITTEEIRQLGASTLVDVLTRIEGIQISSPDGFRRFAIIDGLGGAYAQIFIDGERIFGVDVNAVDIGRIVLSVEDISRIEVLHGTQDALYGGGAVSGVIQIFTKKARAGIQASGFTSTRINPTGFVSQGLHARVAGGNEIIRFNLSGSGTLQSGMGSSLPGSGAGYILPATRSLGLRGNVEVRPLIPGLQLGAQASMMFIERDFFLSSSQYSTENLQDVQGEVSLRGAYAVTDDQKLRFRLRAGRTWGALLKTPLGDDNEPVPFCRGSGSSLQWRFFDQECSREPKEVRTGAQDRVDAEVVFEGTLLENQPLAERISLVVGTSAAVQTRGELERFQLRGSGFGELLYVPVSWWSIRPALRVDVYAPDFGGASIAPAMAPMVSTQFALPFGMYTGGTAALGYRMPSLRERFDVRDSANRYVSPNGDPDLRQETAYHARGNFGWRLSFVRAQASAFANLLLDQVRVLPTIEVPGQGPRNIYTNIGSSVTAGVNLRIALDEIFGVSAKAGYAWLPLAQDISQCPTEDPFLCSELNGAKPLYGVSEHSVWLQAQYRLALTGTTFFTHITLNSDRAIPFQVARIPGYALGRAGISQSLFGHMSLQLTGENLLDVVDPTLGSVNGRTVQILLRGNL